MTQLFFKLIFSIFFVFISLHSMARPKVMFDYKVFYTPDGQPYVETYLEFVSTSVKFKANENGNLQAKLLITQLFTVGDSVIQVDKYELMSPEMLDSTIENFYDVKRFALPNGILDYEIEIKDLYSNEMVTANQSINIPKLSDVRVSFSSITPLQEIYKTDEENDFVKNGLFMLPYLSSYFPPEMDKIALYLEVYNTLKLLGMNETILISFQVQEQYSGQTFEESFTYQKKTVDQVLPIVAVIPIEKLPSGAFLVNISIYNKNNVVVAEEKWYFERRSDLYVPQQLSIENVDISQSFTKDIDLDSIPFYINSLLPIAPQYEYEQILDLLKERDKDKMQKYFHAFWKNKEPLEPYGAWMKYKEKVYKVEKKYHTQIKHGFETDRGRIYLKYGEPNDLTLYYNEEGKHPYEIWHYYKVEEQSNITFVFYNPDLVSNDFPLLHTNLKGEVSNSNWQRVLVK